jgi:hypothetical protein
MSIINQIKETCVYLMFFAAEPNIFVALFAQVGSGAATNKTHT